MEHCEKMKGRYYNSISSFAPRANFITCMLYSNADCRWGDFPKYGLDDRYGPAQEVSL
jgi:hypothetical protein